MAEPQELWNTVDAWIEQRFVPEDAALEGALAASTAGGLPEIAVSAAQGRLLQLLARIQGARRILEIGTLGGYSTIWLARGLPEGGRLVTLESRPPRRGRPRQPRPRRPRPTSSRCGSARRSSPCQS